MGSPDVGLSAPKNRAQRIRINSEGPTGKTVSQPELAGLPASAPLQRPLAVVKSFAATVSLKPGLIVGTAEPESIYTVRLTTKFESSSPAANDECEVLFPLSPQIISLADLEVTVNS